NKPPSLKHLRSFGCLAYATILNSHDKFGSRSEKCVLVGYSNSKKWYKLWSLDNKQVIYSRDVKFFEDIFLFKQNSSTGIDKSVQDVNHLNCFNFNTLDDLSKIPNDEERRNPSPIRHGNSPSHSGSTSAFSNENDVGHSQDADASASENESFTADEDKNNSSEGNNLYDQTQDNGVEPKTYLEVSQHKHWVDAMNAKMDALYRNNTWEIVDLPVGRKTIGSKWVWKIKYKSNGEIERYKARLVAKGFNQREGIDFDETFSPVVKFVTVRCLINLDVQSGWSLFQMDINNAFLYGDLEETAPRQWNAKLTAALLENNFGQSKSDYNLFTKSFGDVFIALLVYVDDIIITGNSLAEIENVKQFLKTKFMIKDLVKLKYFLGIKIVGSNGYVFVDDETMQGLKEAIVKLMKEELGKLRNQMRTMVMTDNNEAVVQKGVQNIPKFGGEDVKGWLVQIEQFFEDNNVPDESKVSFISTHLYEIAWEWHKQFLRIIRGEVAWVIYKEALLLRFGNNKQFLSNDVKDSSCGLHVIDKVGDLLVNNNHCEVNLERSECAHKLFDEMSIKEIHKQYTLAEYCDASVKESIEVEQGLGDDVVVESVKELVDGDNGLIDDRLLASNCDQEGFGEDVNLREKVTDIKTNDVSRLKSFESTKGGLEMLTRNGVNYMEGLVGVGNFQKYEVRLTRVKYALLLMLHECSICLDISSFGQRYVHTAKTKGEYILASKQVFDPGGKQVRDLGGYGGESVFNKLELENNCSVVAVILVGPDIGSSVTTPFVQALFEKDYQWLCDVNKFSKDSISWFCKFRVECVGVQSDVNHDDGLVVCNQLVQECEGYKKDESCNHSYLGLIKLHDVDGKKSNGNSFKDYKIVEIRMTSDYLDTFVVRTTKLNVLMLIGSYGHHTHWKSFAFRVVIGTYKWCRSSKPQGFCLRDENWPIKNSVDCFLVGGMSEFNHSVVSQRTVEDGKKNEAIIAILLGSKGIQNIPKFGGEDVKGWLVQIEQFFEDNNIPDESKVIYKEALLLRFDNNKQFVSDNVKDSSCGLQDIDNVRDLSVNNSHYEVNLEKNEGAHKMFDEMPIKEILKQDTIAEYCDASVKESIAVEKGLDDDVVVESVKELVDEENGLIDDQLLASNCDQDGFSEDVNLGNCDQDGFGEDMNLGEKVTDIKTNDVSRLKSFESTKGGLEMLTRNGVNYMEGLVGVDISAFGQKYVHTAKAKGPDIGCLVTTPFAQTLFGKEYQWLCDMNKFSKDSISWFCKFRVECIGVQSDVNHDDGLVVCNQLV
ncbi:ribonuclease H-like domain-containing protein, partial [Tanacetum coccineum]